MLWPSKMTVFGARPESGMPSICLIVHGPDIERLSSQFPRTKIRDVTRKLHLSEGAAYCVRLRAQMQGKATI